MLWLFTREWLKNGLYLTGIGIDNALSNGINLIKKQGKVKALEDEIAASKFLSFFICATFTIYFYHFPPIIEFSFGMIIIWYDSSIWLQDSWNISLGFFKSPIWLAETGSGKFHLNR